MQILKDYHLCEDLTRLNHDEYFHPDFHTPQIYDALCTPSTPLECLEQSRNRQIYFVNLAHTADKPVLIVLKWLLVAHEIAKGARLVRVVKEMQEALEKMGEPKAGTKYQHFLFERLVKPYRHYLRKLCLVLQACAGGKAMGMQEWFMKYNLVKYALMEFSPVLPEFMPFFQENYPFLARMAAEVTLDLELFLRELKSSHKMQEFKLVEREELESCEEAMGRLREYAPYQAVESLLFTESEFCTGKIQNFFESASKIEGSILFA